MANENTFDVSLLDNENHRAAAIEKLSGSGFVVKSKDEYGKSMSEFLKSLSHEDERVNHLIAPVVRREREAIDGLAKELFPDAQKLKTDDGKTESHLDFLKRTVSSKLEELNKKASKGVSDEQLKKDFDDYKMTNSKELNKLRDQLKSKDLEILQKDITFDVNRSISKREGKFSNDERVKPLIDAHVEAVQRKALEMKPEFRQIGDTKVLVFIDENGSIKYKDGNPYTVDVFVEESLAPIMEKGITIQGAGTGADKDKQSGGGFNIPETINTQIELDEYITAAPPKGLGLNLNDLEVLKKRKEVIKARNLPLQ